MKPARLIASALALLAFAAAFAAPPAEAAQPTSPEISVYLNPD